MRGVGLLAFACVVLPSLPAFANASVVPSGTVSLSHGQGFKEISTPTDALPGDSVIAGPNSSAKIVYSNGCEVDVPPGTIGRIEDHDPSPCKAAALAPRGRYLLGAAAAGGAAVGVCALAGCFSGSSSSSGSNASDP